MGSTKAKWRGNQLAFYDSSTYESVLPVAPIYWMDDFLGKYEDSYTSADNSAGKWVEKITGAGPPTIVMVDSISGGVVSMNLTSDSQKQEAGIYFNDYKNFDLDKGPIIEFRAAVHTAPTDQAEIYFGFSNNYVEGPIAEADAGPTVHAFFMFDGGLVCTLHTDDASVDNNAVATGITVVADVYHIFRIDATDVTNVLFYIDGAGVGTGTTFTMANGANVMVQPFIMVHKEAGAGVGALYVDYVRVWQATR